MCFKCCCKLKDDIREPIHNLYCFECGKYFRTVKELEEHKKKEHKIRYNIKF